jgi:hypothetical protein
VALLATHPPAEDDVEDLKPVTSHVIREVAVLITGDSTDVKAIELVSLYHSHGHINTTVFVTQNVHYEAVARLEHLNDPKVAVRNVSIESIEELVNHLEDKPYDLIVCSFTRFTDGPSSASWGVDGKEELMAPQSQARSVLGGGAFALKYEHVEFGSIGMALYARYVHSLLIVLHAHVSTDGSAERIVAITEVKVNDTIPGADPKTDVEVV